MSEDDENFLKDLAWSEVWFPWKQKGILIRKERSSFWEAFAVVVSALALLVSAWATVGTWRQVDLMREQLTSADRNRAIAAVSDDLYVYCELLMSFPFARRGYKWDFSGPEYDEAWITTNDFNSIKPTDEQKYFTDLSEARRKAMHSFTFLHQWLLADKRSLSISLENAVNDLPIVWVEDPTEREDVYSKLFSASAVCEDIRHELISIVADDRFRTPNEFGRPIRLRIGDAPPQAKTIRD